MSQRLSLISLAQALGETEDETSLESVSTNSGNTRASRQKDPKSKPIAKKMVKPPPKTAPKQPVQQKQGNKNQPLTSKTAHRGRETPRESSSNPESSSSPERNRSPKRGNKAQQRNVRASQRSPAHRTATSSPQRRTASSPQRRSASSPRRAAPSLMRPPKSTGAARRKQKNPLARDMIFLQKTTHDLIPRAPFSRLVREIAQRFDQRIDYRFTAEALDAMRSSTESYITGVFSDAYLITYNRKQVTLQPRDVQLLMYLRGPVGH